MCRQRALRLRDGDFLGLSTGIGVICAAKGHCDAGAPIAARAGCRIGVICATKGHCDKLRFKCLEMFAPIGVICATKGHCDQAEAYRQTSQIHRSDMCHQRALRRCRCQRR